VELLEIKFKEWNLLVPLCIFAVILKMGVFAIGTNPKTVTKCEN